MAKEVFKWEVTALNDSDYRLEIIAKADNKTFVELFQRAKTKLQRTKNLSVKGDIDSINELTIPKIPAYFKVLNYACKKFVNIVNRETMADGFEMLNYEVMNCTFKKSVISEKWKIYLIIEGVYKSGGI